jgi:hypothetical protein
VQVFENTSPHLTYQPSSVFILILSSLSSTMNSSPAVMHDRFCDCADKTLSCRWKILSSKHTNRTRNILKLASPLALEAEHYLSDLEDSNVVIREDAAAAALWTNAHVLLYDPKDPLRVCMSKEKMKYAHGREKLVRDVLWMFGGKRENHKPLNRPETLRETLTRELAEETTVNGVCLLQNVIRRLGRQTLATMFFVGALRQWIIYIPLHGGDDPTLYQSCSGVSIDPLASCLGAQWINLFQLHTEATRPLLPDFCFVALTAFRDEMFATGVWQEALSSNFKSSPHQPVIHQSRLCPWTSTAGQCACSYTLVQDIIEHSEKHSKTFGALSSEQRAQLISQQCLDHHRYGQQCSEWASCTLCSFIDQK